MAPATRIDVIRARLDGAVEMRWLRESMRELSERKRPPAPQSPRMTRDSTPTSSERSTSG